MKKYAVIGSGAVGGYYGARLAKAGYEVHFLFRHDAEHVRKNGISVISFEGDFRIDNPIIHERIEDIPPCDSVILATKTSSNSSVIPHLNRLIDKEGTLIILQNGFGEEDRIHSATGIERIISGLCFIGAARKGAGVIEHQASGGISMALYKCENQAAGIVPELTDVANDFTAAGVQITLEPDWVLARWKKLVWNIPFNGLSVVMNADTHQLLSHPSSRRLVRTLMNEVANGATSLGRHIEESFIERMITYTENMPPYLPSMRLDYDAGRPLEVDTMYFNPVTSAAEAGCDLPSIRFLGEQLSYLTRENQ